jgi:diguanylate cyclase (GGDEF)-like protein/PAS domain S-box-containing protein
MAVLDAALMGVGVFGLAVFFKALTGSAFHVSSLWLANGFALGLLLTAPRARWPLMLGAAALGGAGSALYLHAAPLLIAWVDLFNLLEILLAALALPAIRSAADLTTRRNFIRFLIAAVLVAPLLFTAAIGVLDYVLQGRFNPDMVQRALLGHALGMAVMTPVTLALRNGELRRYLQPAVLPEVGLTLLLVGVVSALVFFQSSLPLLFLIFPPMMRVAFRGGFVGTAVAILLVTVVGALATANGYGPIAAMQASERLRDFPLLADGFLLLHIVIASLLVSLFPLIVSLAEGRRANRAALELQNRLHLLMEHASDIILLSDIEGRRLYVSPAVREVIGFEPEEFLRMTWRDYVHELDQPYIAGQIEEAMRTRTSRTVVFRATHASGRLLWIESHIKYFRDPTFHLLQSEQQRSPLHRVRSPSEDGEGFVATMRDISARRRIELELESANTELASLIRMDSLTGLANRRRFDEALQDAWAKALAGGWPLAVLMIDVDHFKQFNDAYGHQRGDLCLREVARAITSGVFHPNDLAARYGGEEFAVILPQTSTDNAARVAERIRRAVQEMRRPHMASPVGVLTVSVGVAAAYPVTHGDPLSVVRAADQALYTSKHEGRNRTTLLDVSWPDVATVATPAIVVDEAEPAGDSGPSG